MLPLKNVVFVPAELVVGVPLTNVDDFEGSKMGDPAVQVGQFAPGKHKSEDPVSRTKRLGPER